MSTELDDARRVASLATMMGRFDAVRAHFQSIYGLRLPRHLAVFAAYWDSLTGLERDGMRELDLALVAHRLLPPRDLPAMIVANWARDDAQTCPSWACSCRPDPDQDPSGPRGSPSRTSLLRRFTSSRISSGVLGSSSSARISARATRAVDTRRA